LGPSGSGKTTLLDTLFLHPKVQNASNITIEGTITLDSYKMTRAAASRHCAYVSQFVNESLYPALSTIETLRFSASLSDVDPSRSDELCKSLGLWNYRDVKVGNAFMKGLSGGQKKRLSLGCELLDHECRFLFIDEPTSGLDAKSAIEIIKLIRKIAMDRMYRALSEYLIRGIDTNIEFVKAVILDPAFRQGEATTSYVEEFLSRAPKELFEQKKNL